MVVSNAFAILSPTIAVQKEVGLRSSYFNGMFFNVNYFDISKDNTNLISNSPTSVNFQYDGALHLYGYEFSGNAEITREWSVDSSAQFMKAIQIGGANDGKSTENTPETIVSASLSYRTPWVKGLLVRGGVSYVSSRFVGNSVARLWRRGAR
jgi:outer membrane receptor protein involved in Fe transport